MTRQERRAQRRQERAQRSQERRQWWVDTTVDAPLPDHLVDRVPVWATTQRGRILVAALAFVALLCWLLIMLLIIS